MQTRKVRFITFCTSCLLMTTVAIALALLMAVSGNAHTAFAKPSGVLPTPVATGTVNAAAYVTPGTLSMVPGSASQPTAIALDGNDHTEAFTVPITVNDDTGSGSGWDLTVSMTQFTNGSHTLNTSAVSATGISELCASGTCTAPTNNISYTLATPSNGSTSTKFYNAAVNTGLGHFTVTPTFSVSIPASAYLGTYSSVMTISVTSGP